MSDYRVTVKVRNARLLRAIENAGVVCGPKLAADIGIGYAVLLGFVNLTRSPLDDDENITPEAEKLLIYFRRMLCDLWSDEQLEPLLTNKRDLDVDFGSMTERLHWAGNLEALIAPTDPEQATYAQERDALVHATIAELTPKESRVIKGLFGMDGEAKTLDKMGEAFDVRGERVRQIREKALRKMRHPTRRESMKIRGENL